MIFVHSLRLIDAPEDLSWGVELSEANKSLRKDENVDDKAHDAVGAREPSFGMARFVHLNYDEAGDQRRHPNEVKYKMNMCACDLLLRRIGWLEYKDGLREKEDSCRVDKLNMDQ